MTEIENQQPRVMSRWRALPGCQSLPLALWLVCGGLIGLSLSTSAYRILFTRQFVLLKEHSYDSPDVWETIELYSKIFPLLYLAAMAVMMVGLVLLARAPRQHMASVGSWALAAATGFGLVILGDLLPWLGSTVLHNEALGELFVSQAMNLAMVLVRGAAMALLVVAMARTTRTLRAPVPSILFVLAGVWLAWDVGFSLYRMLGRSGVVTGEGSPWPMLLVQLGIWVAGLGLLAYVTARLAQAMNGYNNAAVPDRAAGAGILASPVWDETAAGLELYGSGLKWRVGVAVAGYALLMLGLLSRSMELMKLTIWLLPVATIATSLVMLTGVRRYTQQPDDSPGRTAATLALVFMICGVLIDIYGFVLIIQTLGVDTGDWGAIGRARKAVERADALSVWGMGVSFTSLLILLLSFHQVAEHIGRDDLSKRAGVLAVFLALASMTAIGFRLYAPGARIDIESVIAVAAFVVIVALVAVAMYIGLVGNLAAAVREARSHGDLPAARLVE